MPSNTYRPPEGLRAVLSGVGTVADSLAQELIALNVQRPLIVCGNNIAASPLLEQVKAAAGMDCAVYKGSRPHTPIATVDDGARAMAEFEADAVIALGGSSASDCAKGIIVLNRTGKSSMREIEPMNFARLFAGSAGPAEPSTPLICIPTTLSAAEFQSFFGVLDPEARRKSPYSDQGLISRTVFLDGEIAACTPDHLWAETGVKALDDALSRYCNSQVEEPAADAVLEQAICGLIAKLGPSLPGDPELRQAVLIDTWLTTFEIPRHMPRARGPWFSMIARSALGSALQVPHGIGSCVALAEGLRFHAEATAPRQQRLVALSGLDSGGDAPLAAPMADWMERLGVPTRLGPLKFDRGAIDEVAAKMLQESPALGTEPEVRGACERLW